MRFKEGGILLVLVLMCALLWAVAPRDEAGVSTFLNRGNLMQVARAFSFIGIASVGATFVIVAGGIDLSVGSILGLSVVVCALALSAGWGVAAACAASLAAAGVCGLLSGALVAWGELPPFIVTLGMLSIARGAAYWLTGGRVISGLPDGFVSFGQGFLGALVPVPVAVMVLAVAAGYLILRFTVFGREVLAVGGNEAAAILAGLPVRPVKLAVYGAGGLFAGLAGLMYVARFGYGSSTAGLGWELQVISAVVIGGTSLSGGDGTVLGSMLGAAIIGVLTNGLTLLSVPEEYNQLVVGAVIVTAVLGDRLRAPGRRP